jgi:uncharacterized protein
MSNNNPNSKPFPTEIDPAHLLQSIAQTVSLSPETVQKAIMLLQEGNTVPFIARYRKEVTGALNEVQLRDIAKAHDTLKNLEERRLAVFRLIHEQGKLTSDIQNKIQAATSLQEVEDLYLPFKPKLKTLGTKAKERGLEPLAGLIRQGMKKGTIEDAVKIFINPEKDVPDGKAAIEGAIDIIAEDVGSDPDARQLTREVITQRGIVRSGRVESKNGTKTADPAARGDQPMEGDLENKKKPIDPLTFQDYFDFKLELPQLKPHQIMALNRGEDLEILDINLDAPDEDLVDFIRKRIFKQYPEGSEKTNIFHEIFAKAIEAGYKRYIQRSIKREVWNLLREDAEKHAIKVFATNLKNLLMTPPLKHRAIIGIDPGYRTGCKIAVIDQYGKFLAHDVIYPHPPQKKSEEAIQKLVGLAEKYHAYTFAIGNGTASRETEQLAAEIIKRHKSTKRPFEYAIVDEAGASIYSASEIAIEEFPDLDLTVRGAISIARRLQDPLAELIKIDPKSIGVGMYQHDVNQMALKAELDAVIEDCVNGVGVDLNTASSKLLEAVSGLNKKLAKAIVDRRNTQGPFTDRNQLKDIKGLGPKAFEQSAGFLKIRDAPNPFDRTFVHPESYSLAEQILKNVGLTAADIADIGHNETKKAKLFEVRPKSLAEKLNVDPEKIRFLVDQLTKPDLDPRDNLPPPMLRQDVLSIEDLKPGMIVKGTVRNVVDFGAFVDIGVKVNGLVHKSEMTNRFVKNVHDVIAVGEVKDFMIVSVDKARSRIQLSLKQVPAKK